MTSSKKKRMSMLDSLANAGAPGGASSMMKSNRALRSARDAVDAHHVWELDPEDIDDDRIVDRLNVEDVADLIASIEANGQTVPILVRRHPDDSKRYHLVYGRRRLEAVRSSGRVHKVRALVASLDDDAAVRAQVSENTGRRDLSFIERALFARKLLDSGFGNQAQVAEVLNLTKSAISMSVAIADAIGPELAAAIGPAHGIGRPRWENLVKLLAVCSSDPSQLVKAAFDARELSQNAEVIEQNIQSEAEVTDSSLVAFEAVFRIAKKNSGEFGGPVAGPKNTPIKINGTTVGSVQRTKKGVRMDFDANDAAFASWIENEAQSILEELHGRWKQRS